MFHLIIFQLFLILLNTICNYYSNLFAVFQQLFENEFGCNTNNSWLDVAQYYYTYVHRV